MRFLRDLARISLILLVVAGIVAGGMCLVQRKRAALARAPHFGVRPAPVHVVTARRGDLEETRSYLAVVEPLQTATVAARITAAVTEVSCDEGDHVRAGQALLHLDARQDRDSLAAVDAKIEEAMADLTASEATVKALRTSAAYWDREAERDRTLAAKGAIPGAQAEGTADKAAEIRGKLEAGIQASRGISHQIESLRRTRGELATRLSYCTIASPFDGVVSRRVVDPGDLAAPGKPLLTVEDRSGLKLSFDIPQGDLSVVKTGVPVRFRAGGALRKAKISHLFPTLNRARMLRAEVYLTGGECDGLTSGAYVPLRAVVRALPGATLLPASCLVESPGKKPFVFVAGDGRLQARPVTVVTTAGERIAVEGVEPGEKVVLHTFLGWAQLSSGLAVEVME